MTKNGRVGKDSSFSDSLQRYLGYNKAIDILQLNHKLAYKGKIGRLREQYCLDQIRYMKVCHQKISQDQKEYVEARGETISCGGKGCSFCCSLYIGATLQECEAIAYYLYHNEPILNIILKKGSNWRETVRQSGDLFRNCEQLFTDMLLFGEDKQKEQVLREALRCHNRLKIPCPFLENDLCLVYEVRPSNCAGFFVTSPPNQCRPPISDDPQFDPKFNITTIDDVTYDMSFYYRNLSYPITLYMPVAVYRILYEGFSYLAQFPGQEGLETEALNDPEILAIIQSSSTS